MNGFDSAPQFHTNILIERELIAWAEEVAYLRPGLPGGLGLRGHGALQLHGQSDVLAAEGEDG